MKADYWGRILTLWFSKPGARPKEIHFSPTPGSPEGCWRGPITLWKQQPSAVACMHDTDLGTTHARVCTLHAEHVLQAGHDIWLLSQVKGVLIALAFRPYSCLPPDSSQGSGLLKPHTPCMLAFLPCYRFCDNSKEEMKLLWYDSFVVNLATSC